MAAPKIVVATLTIDEWAVLTRPVNGATGGFQTLFARLLQRANHSERRVTVLPQDRERIERYLAKYGGGGWQDRCRAVKAAIDRAEGV